MEISYTHTHIYIAVLAIIAFISSKIFLETVVLQGWSDKYLAYKRKTKF